MQRARERKKNNGHDRNFGHDSTVLSPHAFLVLLWVGEQKQNWYERGRQTFPLLPLKPVIPPHEAQTLSRHECIAGSDHIPAWPEAAGIDNQQIVTEGEKVEISFAFTGLSGSTMIVFFSTLRMKMTSYATLHKSENPLYCNDANLININCIYQVLHLGQEARAFITLSSL